MVASIKAEALLAAKRKGIASDRVVFSDRLMWVGRDGRLVLLNAYMDADKLTIFPNAIRARGLNVEDIIQKYNEDEPRDDQGRWTDGGGSGEGGSDSDSGPGSSGVEFVSPNVASHLDFHEAATALKGDQQKALSDASDFIDKGLGVAATKYDIIGAWADGAENSVATVVPKDISWDTLRVRVAMKGYIADQKSTLIFKQGAGDQVLYSFHVNNEKLADIHKGLIEDGVAFHTIVPDKDGKGATVLVADMDGSAKDAVKKGAARYDAEVTGRIGKAEFIGTTKEDGTEREQRDSARSVYAGVINESKVQGVEDTWRSVRDRWGAEGLGSDPPIDTSTVKFAFSAGVKASGDNAKVMAVKATWIESSPIKSIDDIVNCAKPAQDSLGEAGREIASKYGVEFKDPGPKTKSENGIERTKVKMAERGGTAARVTDTARATFIVDTPEQVDGIIADLGKKFEVIAENWRVTPVNYADRAVLLRFPNGLIGEIQFMDQKMADAKSDTGGNGHGLYVQWRVLDPKIPEQKAKADELIDKMKALYGGVISSYSPGWKAALGKSLTFLKRWMKSSLVSGVTD